MGNSFFLLKEWLPNPIRPSAVLGAAVAAAVTTQRQRQCHPYVHPTQYTDATKCWGNIFIISICANAHQSQLRVNMTYKLFLNTKFQNV